MKLVFFFRTFDSHLKSAYLSFSSPHQMKVTIALGASLDLLKILGTSEIKINFSEIKTKLIINGFRDFILRGNLVLRRSQEERSI